MMAKSKRRRPAILGGPPAFPDPLPITGPTLPLAARVNRRFAAILASGMITNAAQVRELEATAAGELGAPYAVAVNSCTSGLILAMKLLGLTGEVIIPSFTFHATAHAAVWNGLTPVLVDCDPATYNLSVAAAARAVTNKTSAIVAVHIFGNPADIAGLEKLCRAKKLKLIFDAAHGFGARYRGKPLGGFGDASVFSMSPTKLATAGEAGIVTTHDAALAQALRIGRNYGDSGSNDCAFSGLGARLNEFSAALGIESLRDLERNGRRRGRLAAGYRRALADVPGLGFQRIDRRDRSSDKDFTILINPRQFGLNREQLAAALNKENITVRRYFCPPLHRQSAFRAARNYGQRLAATDRVADNILSLPLSSHLAVAAVTQVALAIRNIYEHRVAVAEALS